MTVSEILADLGNILGNPVTPVYTTSSKKGIYTCRQGLDGFRYVIAMIGATDRESRQFAQMQRGMKPKVIEAYENSKQNRSKFFLLVPDSDVFACNDFYIFIELLEKGGESSSFELDIPSNAPKDRISRYATKNYYITYVPAKDAAGNKSTEILKQYIYSFDSRPYSKYLTKITDFLPSVAGAAEEELKMNVEWPNNFLVAGAPGTGKSFLLESKAEECIKREIFARKNGSDNGFSEEGVNSILEESASSAGTTRDIFWKVLLAKRVRRVTFYEDYSYESFVGCYKPLPAKKQESHEFGFDYQMQHINVKGTTEGTQIVYSYEPGPFLSTYMDAVKNPSELYFLVIEEINRAKAASVFGDMFQLLDRKNGVSEYSITPEPSLDSYLRETLAVEYDGTMRLPKNMFLWATMNNADQGVFPLDSAFKRRWGYRYIDVNSSLKDGTICIAPSREIRWNIFRTYLNQQILSCAAEDKCIGAWYFKDEEFAQIKSYYDADDEKRRDLLNPLADKLLIYLLNDVCRMDPSALFQKKFDNMPEIRCALQNGIGLEEILNIKWDDVFKEQETYQAKLATEQQENQ